MSVLIAFIVFVVIIVVLIEYRERKRKTIESTEQVEGEKIAKVDSQNTTRPLNCCGAHLVCEKELEANPITQIIYYDDEELDVYKDVQSDSYTQEQIDQFADVFYTLKESDVSGWLRSLQARGIQLPDQLKDEALMIVRESRQQ